MVVHINLNLYYLYVGFNFSLNFEKGYMFNLPVDKSSYKSFSGKFHFQLNLTLFGQQGCPKYPRTL